MQVIYEEINPVIFPEEEILTLMDALKVVTDKDNQSFGMTFLNKVFQEYQKRMGKLSREEVQGKLVSDLLFLIKKENLKLWGTTETAI